jgi:3D (Asp-Asp-Asp) domain-containing protein
VIGYNAVGNGSNTATIGNSSITANYFTGSVNGGSFVKSGGTSAQILAADGSVITAGTNITISGGTISSAGGDNIYNANGTLTGNRLVTMGVNTLTFEKDIFIRDLRLGTGATGSNTNTGFGYQVFQSLSSGIRNVAIGYNVLFANTSGTDNVAVGESALISNGAGNENTAVGRVALAANTSGANNSALGNRALLRISSGSNNIGIGSSAGEIIASLANLTTANQSIFIGNSTKALANNQTNQIVIGYNTTGLGSNTTIIGNSSTTDIAIYGRMLVNYSSPVIGTFALDVNGTARVSGDLNVTGVLLDTATTNRQTASYSLVLTDRGKLVEMNVASANTLTIPLNSSIAFPIGTKIDVTQYGAGATTITATGGVTIRSFTSFLKIAGQYAACTLVKIGTDEWYCYGNLIA